MGEDLAGKARLRGGGSGGDQGKCSDLGGALVTQDESEDKEGYEWTYTG